VCTGRHGIRTNPPAPLLFPRDRSYSQTIARAIAVSVHIGRPAGRGIAATGGVAAAVAIAVVVARARARERERERELLDTSSALRVARKENFGKSTSAVSYGAESPASYERETRRVY